LKGKYFLTSKFFPGLYLPDDNNFNLDNSFTSVINCTLRKFWGLKINFADEPKRQPTGLYVPPGCIAKVISPDILLNQGFTIEVGTIRTDHRV